MLAPHAKKIIWTVITLATFGTVMSIYLLVLHYLPGPSFCAVNEVVSCDLVNKGPYGEISGIPVAVIGLTGYLLLTALAISLLLREGRRVLWALRIASTLGFLFSLWLLYIELFLILAICPFCMTSLILITIITGLVWGVEPSSRILENIEH